MSRGSSFTFLLRAGSGGVCVIALCLPLSILEPKGEADDGVGPKGPSGVGSIFFTLRVWVGGVMGMGSDRAGT